jgi:hypothetical protein
VKQHHCFISFISLAFFFFSAPVTAQNIYRWTDAQGRIHFSNAPVSEATAVDDELPPATSFGGVQGSLPSSLQTSPSTEQQPEAPPSTATLSPDERVAEEGFEPANSEEPSTPDREPVTITEEEAVETENKDPEGEGSDVESLPQASVDFSERDEPGTQTAASENQRPSLDEDEDQPAPETRDADEEDSDESEDFDDTDNDEDETEEDEGEDS